MARTQTSEYSEYLSIALQVAEGGPAFIRDGGGAAAGLFVAVDAANRAEAFALRNAKGARGEFEEDLLAEHIVELHAVALIKAEVDVARVEFEFLAREGFRKGLVDKFEIGVDGDIDGSEAAVAFEVERHGEMAREADLLGHFVKGGFTLGDEGAGLGGIWGPLNDAGGNGLAEFDGSEVELADGDKHVLLPSG